MVATCPPTCERARQLTLVYLFVHRSEHIFSRETNLSHFSGSGVMMTAGRAGHPKLSNVWERRKHQWQRGPTLRASLSTATVKVLIDNGVVRSRLDQPWISVKDNKGVRWLWHRVRCLLPDGRQEPIPSLAPTPVMMH